MKIIVFSDVHYFAGDLSTAIFNKNKKLVAYALPLLDKLRECAKEEFNADFCVNLGDTIQDTTTHDGDIEALKFMFDRLRTFPIPVYTVLGNHDLKMMNTVEEVEELLGYKSTYSFDTGGWHFVFLTTEIRCELGTERGGCYKAQYLAEDTLKWLSDDLKNNTLPVVVFTHYGVAEDLEIEDGCMFMKNRAALKAILEADKNVKAVFCGHQHITKTHSENGLKYYNIGSMISCIKVAGIPDAVYYEVELGDGELKAIEKQIEL